MAQEIVITESMTIRASDPTTGIAQVDYRPSDNTFNADMTGKYGPAPGVVSATTAGTDVDLTAVGGGGGMCRIKNQDLTKYVEVGAYDPDVDVFSPLCELLPGEFMRVRLSRFLGQEMGLTGTHQYGAGITLRIKGVGGTVRVLVEAFPA